MLSSTLNITCSVEATEFNRVAVFLWVLLKEGRLGM